MEIGDNLADDLLKQLSSVPEWMEDAACADSDLDPFWDEQRDEFLKLCETCPVIQQCREKFQSLHEETRPIVYGRFHGKDYEE